MIYDLSGFKYLTQFKVLDFVLCALGTGAIGSVEVRWKAIWSNMQDCVGQWQQRPDRGRANVKQIQKKCWTMTSTGRRVQLSPPLCRAAPRKPGWNPFQKYDYNWSPRSLGWSIYELNLPLKSVEKSQAVAPVLNPVISQVWLSINIFNQQNIRMKRGKGEYSLPHPTALPPTVRATGKARQAALPEPPGPPAGSRTGDPSPLRRHRPHCCCLPGPTSATGGPWESGCRATQGLGHCCRVLQRSSKLDTGPSWRCALKRAFWKWAVITFE